MKKITILFILCWATVFCANGQSGMWTWMHGPNTPNDLGNYGTMGVASPTNVPPPRYQAAYWADTNGNFWVFGGSDFNTNFTMNDLWKYDIATNMWTWMHGPQFGNNMVGNFGTQGISSPLNIPPARGWGANCWTGSDGHLYLYGGSNFGSSFDDLWQYNISTNEWTWIHGNTIGPVTPIYGTKGVPSPTNTPGSRQECKSGWTTPNLLWTFGGDDNNDLWSFDLSTHLWTWEAGDAFIGSLGNYGIKGVAAPTNAPPGRFSYTKWKDSKGHFYIFAGYGNFNQLNDLWAYDLNTKMWTWTSGTQNINDLGQDNGNCIEDVNNSPASRMENQTAQTNSECANAFWTFGGFDINNSKSFNDLWIYNSTNNKWTLAWGNNTPYLGTGVYGTQGTANAGNIIPARGGVCIWTDKNQNLWVFGGLDIKNTPNDLYNDMWKFTPDANCFDILASNSSFNWPGNLSICQGQTATIQFPPGTQISTVPTIGASYDVATGILTLTPNGTTNFAITAQTPIGTPCPINETKTVTVSLRQKPIAAFTFNQQTSTLSNPVFSTTNTSQHATNYTWYVDNQYVSNATDITQTMSQVGHYCFKLVAENDCGKDSVTHCIDVVQPIFVPNAFSPNSDGNNDYFSLVTSNPVDNLTILIYDRWGENVFTGDNEHPKWDGKHKGRDCDVGTYYYQITYYLSGKQFISKGDINLVR